MKLERRKKGTKKKRYVVRGQITADIREGVSVFVVLIIAAVAVAIAAGVGSYILNALGPATNSTIVSQGQQAVSATVNAFNTAAVMLGGLVLGIIAFGFLRRIWKEFTS